MASTFLQYVVYIKRKDIPAHETAPWFLYKPIKLATYSYASTRLPSKKIHAPIWSMVALEGNYLFDQNKIIINFPDLCIVRR